MRDLQTILTILDALLHARKVYRGVGVTIAHKRQRSAVFIFPPRNAQTRPEGDHPALRRRGIVGGRPSKDAALSMIKALPNVLTVKPLPETGMTVVWPVNDLSQPLLTADIEVIMGMKLYAYIAIGPEE